MEPIEIIKLGRDMRNAQKAYFRTRTITNLKKSKHLEKCFDDAVQNFLNPSKQLCFDNFNTQPAPWLDLPIEPLNGYTMQRQITQDQCYCSFGDGIVYEFVPTDCVSHLNDCHLCALWFVTDPSVERIKCLSVPCQKGLRMDKNGGFWRISNDIDYQVFTKMLKNGGGR